MKSTLFLLLVCLLALVFPQNIMAAGLTAQHVSAGGGSHLISCLIGGLVFGAILTGRYGQVSYDPVPASPYNPVALISINSWKLSLKTDYEDVSCFLDTNKVYIPGLRDISGTIGGFWNSANVVLIEASSATTPGVVKLTPNINEPTFYFEGLAYMDADIDCSLQAPKITGTIKAAGPWITP